MFQSELNSTHHSFSEKLSLFLKFYKPRRLCFEGFIYGGSRIRGNLAPWAVQLEVGEETRCSGVLISQRHVLSASSCVMQDVSLHAPYLDHLKHICDNNGQDMVFSTTTQLFKLFGSNGQLLSQDVVNMVLFNYCTEANWEYDDMMLLELKDDISLDNYT